MLTDKDVKVFINHSIIFDRYLLNKYGVFISLESGRELKSYIHLGYHSINLMRQDGSELIKEVIKVHRALAMSFIPNPNNYPIINHIDADKGNNNLSNLEWCTHSENTLHSYREGLGEAAREAMRITGLKNKGKNPYASKKVIDIKNFNIYSSIKDAAKSIKIHRHTLARMLKGEKNNETNFRLYDEVFKNLPDEDHIQTYIKQAKINLQNR